jgi:protoheme IX farnesyltransferase
MLLITALPYLTGMSGLPYLVVAMLLGGGFLYHAINLMVTTRPQAPMQTFRYSIVYLIALFVALLVDHYL